MLSVGFNNSEDGSIFNPFLGKIFNSNKERGIIVVFRCAVAKEISKSAAWTVSRGNGENTNGLVYIRISFG